MMNRWDQETRDIQALWRNVGRLWLALVPRDRFWETFGDWCIFLPLMNSDFRTLMHMVLANSPHMVRYNDLCWCDLQTYFRHSIFVRKQDPFPLIFREESFGNLLG